MERAETEAKIAELIAPFNKKGVAIHDTSSFAGDLEFDSLTVMDFVAAIEDEFDIIISHEPAGRDRNLWPVGRCGSQTARLMAMGDAGVVEVAAEPRKSAPKNPTCFRQVRSA